MRIGIDVGGTFTDLVVAGGSRGLWFVKTPSTPEDPSAGVIDGLRLVADELSLPLEAMLASVELLIHGTTVATNILVERKGAKVGMLTTRGFRDLLELRDGTKQRRYRLREAFPELLVPRELRLEIGERTRWDGTVQHALPVDEVDVAAAQLRASGVESVVVCFLHSHRFGGHESAVRERLHASGWAPYVSLSHEVLGKVGEYDRLSTATVNAYVGPGLARYLERLALDLECKGVRTPLLIMQSNGGVLPAHDAVRQAVGAVTSGPAGGAMSGVLFARSRGLPRVVTYDTGGTSTDVCVIEDAVPIEVHQKELAEARIAIPAVEINPLAVGGGSIAWIDRGGILDLGPRSAGAKPGPACFGHGGDEPTLTDANVVLGYIATDTFLGGRMRLSREAAIAAMRRGICEPLGVSLEEGALAVHAVATSRITEGIRLATVRRGADPRDFSLISFGGAGGLHADAVARELQIPETIIPRQAAVLSALGFLAADVRHDYHRPMDLGLTDARLGDIRQCLDDLERQGTRALTDGGFAKADIHFRWLFDCRYRKQVNSVPIAVVAGDLDAGPGAVARKFEHEYRKLYGHVHAIDQVVVDTIRVAAFGRLPALGLPKLEPAPGPCPSTARRGTRSAFLGQWKDVPVYWFDDLAPGMQLAGPALVDSPSTTIIVHENGIARVDDVGSLCIRHSPMGESS